MTSDEAGKPIGLTPTERADLVVRYRRLRGARTSAFSLEAARLIAVVRDLPSFRQDKNNWLAAIQQHPRATGAEIAGLLFEFYLANEDTSRERLISIWQPLLKDGPSYLIAGTRGILERQLGILENSQGQFDRALAHFQVAIALHRELGDISLLGNDYYEAGSVYRNLGDYENAWAAFLQAEDFARQAGNLKTVIYSQGQRANLMAVQSRFGDAIQLLEQSLTIWDRFPLDQDRNLRHTTLHTLGRIYIEDGEFSQARHMLQESLRLKETSQERFDSIVRTRSALAEASIGLGEIDVAARYLDEDMVEKCAGMGSHLYAASAFKTLSRMRFMQRTWPEAIRLLNRALDTAILSHNPLTRFEVLLWAVSMHSRLGNFVAGGAAFLRLLLVLFELRLSMGEVLKLVFRRARALQIRK